MLSLTVTVALQVDELPEASATVSTAAIGPSIAQVYTLGTTILDTIAQLSVLPLSTAPGMIEAVPPPFTDTVMSLHCATGGVTSVMVTVAVQLPEKPTTSATV